MYTFSYNDLQIKYRLTNENVHIVDSYLIHDTIDMKNILIGIKDFAKEQGFIYKRSNGSWLAEWKAHNWLYDHGIEQDRTKAVDLNENESFIKRVCYRIISFLYRP